MSLIQLEETTSTNSWLKANRAQLCHGDAVTALRQTEGRGRLGNVWLGAQGMLPVSVLLRNIAHPQSVTLAAGAAVCAQLEALAGQPVMIKWPNDIILRGCKLCGILCESASNGDGLDIICGVGVNISQSADYFESAGIPHGGSLMSLAGIAADRRDLAEAISQRIVQYAEKPFAEIYGEYKARCITLGKQVRIISNGEQRVAFAEDIADSGYLICRDENGVFEVNSGEVSVRGLLGYV